MNKLIFMLFSPCFIFLSYFSISQWKKNKGKTFAWIIKLGNFNETNQLSWIFPNWKKENKNFPREIPSFTSRKLKTRSDSLHSISLAPLALPKKMGKILKISQVIFYHYLIGKERKFFTGNCSLQFLSCSPLLSVEKQ